MTKSGVLDKLYAERDFLEIEVESGMSLNERDREALGEKLDDVKARIKQLERE